MRHRVFQRCNPFISRVVDSAKFVDVEFTHLQHRLHGASRTLHVVASENISQSLRHDVPGESIAVGDPSARQLLPACGEPFPEVVDLGLGGTTREERDLSLRETLGRPVGALIAMNDCPSSSNSTVITEPAGPGPASP
jgi:hypothetical protein